MWAPSPTPYLSSKKSVKSEFCQFYRQWILLTAKYKKHWPSLVLQVRVPLRPVGHLNNYSSVGLAQQIFRASNHALSGNHQLSVWSPSTNIGSEHKMDQLEQGLLKNLLWQMCLLRMAILLESVWASGKSHSASLGSSSGPDVLHKALSGEMMAWGGETSST